MHQHPVASDTPQILPVVGHFPIDGLLNIPGGNINQNGPDNAKFGEFGFRAVAGHQYMRIESEEKLLLAEENDSGVIIEGEPLAVDQAVAQVFDGERR